MSSAVQGERPSSGPGEASHPYTCNTCQVAYRNIELQKSHMKSDWHRYNLKRRVASLPPISVDTFTEKVLQARAVSTAEADKAYFERACVACQKTYYSENAFQNHLLSQKHKQNEAAAGEHPEDEARSVISSTFSLGEPTIAPRQAMDSDAKDEFSEVVKGLSNGKQDEQRPSPVKRPSNPQATFTRGQTHTQTDESLSNRGSGSTTPVQQNSEAAWTLQTCIFCSYISPTTPLNAQHMGRFHGMFVPEKDYLVDLDGLLEYLQRKVRQQNECLSCGKIRANTFAIQTHMRDTGHCRIPFETEAEQLAVGDFYDFRSTYSDSEDSDDDADDGISGGAKLNAHRPVKTRSLGANEGDREEDGDGWETDSSASSLDSADLTAVPAEGHIHQFERLDKHPHHSHQNPRNRHQADGWHSHAHKHNHAVFHDDFELHLPSGKSVGHRSLNKYYKQNLVNYPTLEEQAESKAIQESERLSDDDNGEEATQSGARGRQVIPRGAAGLMGVSDQKKQIVRKSEQRGRNLETFETKRTDWSYSRKLNNHKNYYYREKGGG